jgi:two-component system sensor histidine kinase QseC
MKLLHYTYRKLSLLLLLLMAAWGVLFYYAIIDEVMKRMIRLKTIVRY